MKIAGLLISSAALILTAFQALSMQKRQMDTERELCAVLEQIAAELGEHSTPLPALMDALVHDVSPLLRPFFSALCESLQLLDEQSLSDSWRRAVDSRLPLPDTQKRVLYQLGTYLGRYSGEQQSRAVLSVREELLRDLRCRETSAADKRRLTTGLTAALISMLLILNL